MQMKLVCMSDTHSRELLTLPGKSIKVPDGDVLLHAGDFCGDSTIETLYMFADWFYEFPHKYKLVIAGNHDWPCQVNRKRCEEIFFKRGIHYLEDSGTTIDNLNFWGSPWQPEFNNWAFNLPRNGVQLNRKWDLIPTDTDVLITHSPPKGILDKVKGKPNEHLGCPHLYDQVTTRIKPKVHIFGHIHTGHGQKMHKGIKFVNASLLDEEYKVTYSVREVTLKYTRG